MAPREFRAAHRTSKDSARAIVVRALRERGVADAVLNSLVVVSESTNPRTGVRDVRFEQRVSGLWVYDTYVRAAIRSSGEVIQIIDATVAVPRNVPGARASAQQALGAALRRLHPEFPGNPAVRGQNGNATVFAGGPFFHSDPTVTRVAIPLTDGTVRPGFLVETWTEQRNLLNHTLVEGDGTVLAVESRTVQDSYNIFRVNPVVTPQEVVAGPAAGGIESPAGWLFAGSQRSRRYCRQQRARLSRHRREQHARCGRHGRRRRQLSDGGRSVGSRRLRPATRTSRRRTCST